MSEECETKERRLEAYKSSLATRQFEIDLFWKRALFFWGFIAAAFVGYATLKKDAHHELALAVACFGTVCSFAWTLANRGSKYWQENWEAKVAQLEVYTTGPLFSLPEPRQRKGFWGAYQFSVSRLAIALSDFTFLFWAGITGIETWSLVVREPLTACGRGVLISLVPGFSACYLLLMLKYGRGKPPPQPRTSAETPP